jgi:hypothetical protein
LDYQSTFFDFVATGHYQGFDGLVTALFVAEEPTVFWEKENLSSLDDDFS